MSERKGISQKKLRNLSKSRTEHLRSGIATSVLNHSLGEILSGEFFHANVLKGILKRVGDKDGVYRKAISERITYDPSKPLRPFIM